MTPSPAASSRGTRLPPALRAWEAELSAFDVEVAAAIGPWLSRLSLGIGPLHLPVRSGAEAHDGFAGVSRRGPYERLLLTEWGLADAEPEEFLRRAAMNEHLFLEPDRADPDGANASVAVFDCGPDQLGTPRLAHIALALVLARRAAQAGVPFFVAVLGQVDPVSWSGPQTVDALLKSRTSRRNPESTAWWAQRLSRDRRVDGWLVGDRFDGWSGPAIRVEPREKHLEIDVRGGVSARFELPLPSRAIAVRCLRNPWPVLPPRDAATGRATAMRFSVDERRLLIATSRGPLALSIPNSPRQAPGRASRFHGSPCVALGWRGTSWLSLEVVGSELVARPGHRRAAVGYAFPVTDALSGLPPPALLTHRGLLWLEPGDGPSDVWCWPLSGGEPPSRLPHPACSPALVRGRARAVALVDGRRVAASLDRAETPLAGGDLGDGPWWGAWSASEELLFQRDDGSFAIRGADGRHREVPTREGVRPVGIAKGRVVGVDYRTLGWVDQDDRDEPLLTLESPVEDCVASPGGLVAIRTQSGALCVWSSAIEALVYQSEPE